MGCSHRLCPGWTCPPLACPRLPWAPCCPITQKTRQASRSVQWVRLRVGRLGGWRRLRGPRASWEVGNRQGHSIFCQPLPHGQLCLHRTRCHHVGERVPHCRSRGRRWQCQCGSQGGHLHPLVAEWAGRGTLQASPQSTQTWGWLGQGPWLGLLSDTGVHRFRSSNGGAVLDEGPQPRVQTGVPRGRQLPRARAQR